MNVSFSNEYWKYAFTELDNLKGKGHWDAVDSEYEKCHQIEMGFKIIAIP